MVIVQANVPAAPIVEVVLVATISIHIIAAMPATHMKAHWYHILLALSGGERHGLAIARTVRESSLGRIRLWPATLYGSLEELADAGWIEEIEAARRADASERKRYYGITRSGRAAFDAETRRLADLVRLARQAGRRQHA
jgi:DNA-binding PadR family transcriptional regulator